MVTVYQMIFLLYNKKRCYYIYLNEVLILKNINKINNKQKYLFIKLLKMLANKKLYFIIASVWAISSVG